MEFALTNNTIDRYFRFLSKLDNRSKKNLIIKLTESINPNDDENFDLASLYGAWEDDRTSDEIIKDIKDSRIDKQNTTNFE